MFFFISEDVYFYNSGGKTIKIFSSVINKNAVNCEFNIKMLSILAITTMIVCIVLMKHFFFREMRRFFLINSHNWSIASAFWRKSLKFSSHAFQKRILWSGFSSFSLLFRLFLHHEYDGLMFQPWLWIDAKSRLDLHDAVLFHCIVSKRGIYFKHSFSCLNFQSVYVWQII